MTSKSEHIDLFNQQGIEHIIPYMTQFLQITDIMNLKLTCKCMNHILRGVDTNLTHFLTRCITNADSASWDAVENNYYYFCESDPTNINGRLFFSQYYKKCYAELAVFLKNQELLRASILTNTDIFFAKDTEDGLKNCIHSGWFEGIKILCEIYCLSSNRYRLRSLSKAIIQYNGSIEMFRYVKDVELHLS